MKTDADNPVDDARLTRALAEVMSHLRSRQYGTVLDHFEEALRGSADAFVDTLARHLIYEEKILFPAVRSLDTAATDGIGGLLEEHGRLRRRAEALAGLVKNGRLSEAYDVARTFLAELLDHIGRESEILDRCSEETICPPSHLPLR